jgi:hypothetical protein
MNVGSVFNAILNFSDPELGQVQPGSYGEFGIFDVIILLFIVCTIAGIIIDTYEKKRRRRG